MKSAATVIVMFSVFTCCTAIFAIPPVIAQMMSGLSHLTGFKLPGVPPVPVASPVNESLAPAGGLPEGSPAGQLPGDANLPTGNLPGAKLPTGNLPGANLPTGNLPGANLPTGNLPAVPSAGKKAVKPKPTLAKLTGHQNCLETYFHPCASGNLFYCYLLHVCVKMY